MSSADSNPELESFREKWRAEVQSRHSQQHPAAGPSITRPRPQAQGRAAAAPERLAPLTEPPRQPAPQPTKKSKARDDDDEEDDYAPSVSFDEPAGTAGTAVGEPSTSVSTKAEPVTALEYYEKAVEREAVGNHGDSVKLYRKAFRMDDTVDQKYRNKYFPKAPPKATSATDSGPAPASPSQKPEQPQSMKELIASFSALAIEPAAPEIEGTPQSPCPIAAIPDEILVHILRDVAILDVGDFVRLAQVCKRLAFLVATEDRIWRRICLGAEFGFGGMHYHWQRQITWEPLTDEDLAREAEEAVASAEAPEGEEESILPPLTLSERTEQQYAESTANTLAFYNSLYSSSWLRMFRLRPRIRFNGCYISTVNYVRPGQANPNLITWNTPMHIVTYYRYLRFFRDGTCISLLTTAEPANVVHHLTREAVALHSRGAAAHLPSIVVQSALRGRWRLAKAADNPDASLSEVEGDLIVETEGVSKYIYRLDLTLKTTAGKGASAKNTKLVWRGHYSYNRLTDDWAPFTLRNDKPFFFSRVKSYGVQGA